MFYSPNQVIDFLENNNINYNVKYNNDIDLKTITIYIKCSKNQQILHHIDSYRNNQFLPLSIKIIDLLIKIIRKRGKYIKKIFKTKIFEIKSKEDIEKEDTKSFLSLLNS